MKIKIGLLFGGNSTEHEVSIISALQAMENFNKSKYDILPIYITKDNEFYVSEYVGNIQEYKNIDDLIKKSERVVFVKNNNRVDLLKVNRSLLKKDIYDTIDVIFPVVHGTNVEDGVLAGFLKILDIPYVGCDTMASALGMDKYYMKCVLKENNINVLNGNVYLKYQYSEDEDKLILKIEKDFSYPVIVKPVNLGSSVGIKIAKNREDLKDALKYAFEFSYKIIVERAVTNIMELNCSVLGDMENQIASAIERPIGKSEILSFEDKYLSDEGTIDKLEDNKKGTMENLSRELPAKISENLKLKVQEMAKSTFKVLGCNGVARVDFIVDLGEEKTYNIENNNYNVYVNEINTIPGSLSFYLWKENGISYEELLDKMIELAFKRSREESDIVFSFKSNILDKASLNGLKGSKK